MLCLRAALASSGTEPLNSGGVSVSPEASCEAPSQSLENWGLDYWVVPECGCRNSPPDPGTASGTVSALCRSVLPSSGLLQPGPYTLGPPPAPPPPAPHTLCNSIWAPFCARKMLPALHAWVSPSRIPHHTSLSPPVPCPSSIPQPGATSSKWPPCFTLSQPPTTY